MLRPISCLTALLGAALVAAAPTPRETETAGPYFSVRAGTRWVYEVTSQGKSRGTNINRVSAVEEVEGGHNVRIIPMSPQNPQADLSVGHHTMRVTATGVAHAIDHSDQLVPHLPENHRRDIVTPYRYDQYVLPVLTPQCCGKITVHGLEDVRVPAGVFRAIRVEREEWTEVPMDGRYFPDTDKGVTHITIWYAPGVGPVKYITKPEGKPPVLTELQSFTPGKP